jgi:hypothetical protein
MNQSVDQFLDQCYSSSVGPPELPAAVDALEAAGLLTSAEARSRREEHRRVAAAQQHVARSPLDPELEERAIELLESLKEPLRPRDSDEWDPAAFQRYQEAIMALSMVGAMGGARTLPYSRLHQELIRPARRPPEPKPEPEMPFVAGELSAVLVGPSQRSDGRRVTSLELYDDCVIVRYHITLPAEPSDPDEREALLRMSFRVEDDVGTNYEVAFIPVPNGCERPSLDEWPLAISNWQAVTPGPPLDVAEFTVYMDGVPFVVPVEQERSGFAS